MKYLNFNNLKNDNYNGVEFISSSDINSWFIVYSRIDTKSYTGHLGLDYEFSNLEGNIIVLKNDNYVENLELIIQETNEKVDVLFRISDEGNINLISRLNSNLEIIESGNWEETEIVLNQQSFSTIEDLVKRIDEYFFYDFFEAY